jgi:tetratricopeptide (TPR) repeat protein
MSLVSAQARPTPSGAPDAEAERFLSHGLELLLRDQFAAARAAFEAESDRRPNEALPEVALMLLDQLEMYELDNLAREPEFRTHAKTALERARQAIRRRNLPWDHAMVAAIHGMDGLQHARRERWLGAARLGLKAKGSLERALRLDPDFADAYLGLGVYHYYASVLTRSYWFLPGFGDQRRRGIEEVLRARDQSLNFKVLAEFALLYLYYDEKRYREAHELAVALAAQYPANALSRSWLGWMQLKLGRYSAAAETFRRVRDGGPGRYHCQYHLGTSLLFEGRDVRGSIRALQEFLATEPPSFWRARAYHRLGMAHLRLGDRKAARGAWRAAATIDPDFRAAKERLALLDQEPAQPTPKPTAGAAAPLARRNEDP